MDRQDDFLYSQRKAPRPAAVEALWQKLASQEQRRPWGMNAIIPTAIPAAIAASLVTVLVLLAAIAPVRVAAQDVLRLFVQAAQNTFSIRMTFDDPAHPRVGVEGVAEPPNVDMEVTMGSAPDALRPRIMHESLDAAAAQADVPLLAPAHLPAGYEFLHAVVRSGSPLITLVYGNGDVPLLTLHQTRALSNAPTAHLSTSIHLGEALEPAADANLRADMAFGEIGSDARIEAVQIGDAPGEYVHGAWKFDTEPAADERTTSGATVTVTPVWDADAAGQMLRWQIDDTFLELIAWDDALSASELVEIAASVAPRN